MCANGTYTSEATQDKTTKVLHTSSYKWTLRVVCFIFLRRRYSVSRVQRKRRWWALGEWISNDQTRTFVKEPVSIYSFSLLNSSCAWDCFPEVTSYKTRFKVNWLDLLKHTKHKDLRLFA